MHIDIILYTYMHIGIILRICIIMICNRYNNVCMLSRSIQRRVFIPPLASISSGTHMHTHILLSIGEDHNILYNDLYSTVCTIFPGR